MKTLNKKHLFAALILNIIIVFMEIVGIILSVCKHGLGVFQFYTENSNYFALIASLLFCLSCVRAINKSTPLPQYIHVLRFVSASSLTITFFIVLTVIIPVNPSSFTEMIFMGSNIFHHVLCPILSFVSFVWLESETQISKTSLLAILIPTIVYGIICIILNILKIIVGPYPFFFVYAMPWYFVVLALIGVLAVVLGLSIFVLWLRNKQARKG